MAEEIVETGAVFYVGVVGAIVREEIVEIVAAAALLRLLAPEAMRVDGPWARMFGLTDANGVERCMVDAEVGAGTEKARKQDRGTKHSACKASAQDRRIPETFAFCVRKSG